MKVVTDLICDTPIPRMVRVRQKFDDTCIPPESIRETVLKELHREEIAAGVKPGMKIAVTCGSRGIYNVAVMAKAIVDFVKERPPAPRNVSAGGGCCF